MPSMKASRPPDRSYLEHLHRQPAESRAHPQQAYWYPSGYTCYSQPLTGYRQSLQHRTQFKMDTAEMEHFQNLSDKYAANLPGPLVSDKQPIQTLIEEYAQADPQFVAKTMSLSHTHNGYRAVKGDGQCGWRSTVFAYFEKLLSLQDLNLAQMEKIRVESFKDTMIMVGIDYDIMIDMFDCTFELFDKIIAAVQSRNTDTKAVLEHLNEENISDSIVYHFKMMTSAFMALRAEDYEPFLEMSVPEYRLARIDPTNQEIDQIGLQVLCDAIIKPANFALQVLYLDRSDGDEVTPHDFTNAPVHAPLIELLYRPGHYDIIYKDQHNVIVNLMTRQDIPNLMGRAEQISPIHDTLNYLFRGSGNLTNYDYNLSNEVGFGAYPPSIGPQEPLMNMRQVAYRPQTESRPLPPTIIPQPYRSPHTSEIAQRPSPEVVQRTAAVQSPSRRRSTQVPTQDLLAESPTPATPQSAECQIRFSTSMYQLRRHRSIPLSPNSTASGHTAHYRHETFEPQQWHPENGRRRT